MKFSTKLTALFLVIMIPVSIFVSSAVYISNRKSLEEQIKHRLQGIAFHVMDKIDRTFYERLADVKFLATDMIISSPNSTPEQITKRLIECRNQYNAYASLSFFDLNRIRIADTAGLNIGVKQPESYKQDIDIYESASLKMPVIHFVSVVKDDKGHKIGSVVARMSLARLYEITREAEGNDVEKQHLKIDLVNREGLLIYSNNNRKGFLKDSLSGYESFKKAIAEAKTGSLTHYDPIDDEQDLFVFATEQGYGNFKGSGWVLLLHMPTKIAFAPAVQLRNKMLVVLVAIIAVTILISLVFSRSVTKPIIALRNAAIEIGKGMLDTKITVQSNDEIGQLSASFQKMAQDLKSSTTSIDNLNREITERKQAQEKAQTHQTELLHMSRLSTVGEMATGLAHELNQPLCAAMNYITVCLHTVRSGGDANTDKFIENMEAIAKQTKRAGEIVNRIKDFVRKREPHQSTVDINELVKEMSDFVHVDIRKNKVSLNLALAEELPLLLADPVQIEQVLLNLMLNGIDAMADVEIEKRQLTIQTQMCDDHFVEVAVSDTGKAVSEEDFEKMFDSFFTTKPCGLGIGLSISRSIIDAHKGRLWARANPDCGMTFRFTLPVAGSI